MDQGLADHRLDHIGPERFGNEIDGFASLARKQRMWKGGDEDHRDIEKFADVLCGLGAR